MAHNEIVTSYDDAGYPASAAQTASVNLAANSGAQVVKGGPGRLVSVTVTTVTAGAAATIFDNPSAGAGTPLCVIPAGTAVGTSFPVNLPAGAGLFVSSPGATGAITVAFS